MENSEIPKSDESRRLLLAVLAGYCAFLLSSPLSAETTFGIYDARTMAMGGVSVASANNDNAQFYNGALLAFNEEIEERTQDSRFLFPLLVPQVSESAIEIEEIVGDDLALTISRAVTDFNAMPSAQSAQAVVASTADLSVSLAAIDDKDLLADLYFGLALSEPGKFQGAGVFMGVRLLAGGQSTVPAADLALLEAYQEGLSFIASGGTQGAAHPELFDANGALIDPSNDFNSTANATGVAITEIGVATSHQIHLFGHPVAFSLSFKAIGIDTFEDSVQTTGDRIDVDRNSEADANINFDIGLAKEFGERWRVGVAIKDIFPHNYKTSLGSIIRLRPRARIGAAYQAGRLQIAADADVIQNEPLGSERATQEVAIGAELAFSQAIKLRSGYRHDIRGNRDGIVSIGVGTLWKRLAIDVAYAEGHDARSAALQFGVAF